jgi:hypothetical protein
MHIRLATITTPERHQAFVKEINERKYPVEGQLRRGFASPHIAEIKFWDIRAKKEIVPQTLMDCQSLDLANEKHLGAAGDSNVAHHIPWYVRKPVVWMTKLFRYVTNHQVPEYSTPDREAKYDALPKTGWKYAFVIGCYKDPEREGGIEEL